MEKLEMCRIAKGYSQKYVAVALGVAAPTVSQWESGSKEPSKDNLIKLADLYGVTVDYLLGHDVSAHDSEISDTESQLIFMFRTLNSTGQKRAIETLTLFNMLPEYQ